MGVNICSQVVLAASTMLAFAYLLFGQIPGECAAGEPPVSQVTLRFDGVYRTELQNDLYYHLRFFDDGTVITVPSKVALTTISKPLDGKRKEIGHGTFVIIGTRIVFSTILDDGKVEYDGVLKGDKIELRWYSRISEQRGEEKYSFVKSMAR
jgi:hypothetical protein